MLSQKAKLRLGKLVKYVREEVGREEFSMAVWVRSGDRASDSWKGWDLGKEECGTVACMAGHATNIPSLRLWLVDESCSPVDQEWLPTYIPRGCMDKPEEWVTGDPIRALALAFDITEGQAYELFVSHFYLDRWETCDRFEQFIRDDGPVP